MKLKPLIAKKAKEQHATYSEQGYQKSDKANHTAKELAKVAAVSHDTIHKDGRKFINSVLPRQKPFKAVLVCLGYSPH